MKKNALFGLTIIVSLSLLLFACRKDIKFYLEDKTKASSAMLESAKIWRLQRLSANALVKNGRATEILKPLWSDSWTIQAHSESILVVPAPERFQRNKNVQIRRFFIFKQNTGNVIDGKIVEIVAKNYDLAKNLDKILLNLSEESNTDFNGAILFYDINYRKIAGQSYQNGKKTNINTQIEAQVLSSKTNLARQVAMSSSTICTPVFPTKVGYPLITCDDAMIIFIADYAYNSDGCITALTYTYVSHSCPGDNTGGGSGSGSGSGTGSSGNPEYGGGGGSDDQGCGGLAAAHTLVTETTVAGKLTALNQYNIDLPVNNPGEIEYGAGFYLTSQNMAGGYKTPTITSGTAGFWPPPAFTWNSTDGYKILEAHIHVDGNAPSPSDVMYMAKNLADVPTSDKAFYKTNVASMVVTKYGNYLVKVKDWDGFLAEYNVYKNATGNTYNTAYLDQIPGIAAAGALFLKKFGAFLYLYKSDPGSTDFKPLKLVQNNGTGIVECPSN